MEDLNLDETKAMRPEENFEEKKEEALKEQKELVDSFNFRVLFFLANSNKRKKRNRKF